MNLRFLEAFVWIARLGSFRRAALRLNLSQATVSSRIATLEDQFGQRLFERRHHELRLTDAGRTLLVHSERILDAQRELVQAITRRDPPPGTIRLGVIESAMHMFLADMLSRIQKANPRLTLEITCEPSRVLCRLLERGKLDIAILSDPQSAAEMKNDHLCELPIRWVAAPDLLARGGDIGRQPLVTFTSGSIPHGAMFGALQDIGTVPGVVHCTTSVSFITKLAKMGLGLAVTPAAPLRDEIDSGALVEVDAAGFIGLGENIENAGRLVDLGTLPLMLSYRCRSVSDALETVIRAVHEQVAEYCSGAGARFAMMA